MKSKTIFKAESHAESFLFAIFLAVAVYLFVQMILFIADIFHEIDLSFAMAGLR
jgi:hypothetical protein